MEIGRSQLVAWIAAGLILAVVAVRFLGGESAAEAPPVSVDGGTAAADGSGAGATGGMGGADAAGGGDGGLYVHVAGAVARAGLYRVPSGSRVAAAIEVAGGTTRRAEVAAVNLAAPLQDGQQVVVPLRGRGGGAAAAGAAAAAAGGATGAAGATGTAGPQPAGAKLSLSTATVEQLDTLDGIGPTLAARIVEYRDAHGGFRSIDELREVEGIGEKRFESLRSAVQP